jgi:hypothetical protein
MQYHELFRPQAKKKGYAGRMGRVLRIAGLALACSTCWVPAAWAQHKRGEYAWITGALGSRSDGRQTEGIRLIEHLMSRPGHYALPFRLAYNWLPVLLRKGHDATVAKLSYESILANPGYTILVGIWQQERVEALLAMGKVNAALRNAKSLFYECPLGQTRTALLLLQECLEKKYPGGNKLIKLFIDEQMAGAGKAGVSCKVLTLIKINAKPYEAALQQIHGTSQWDLTEKMNLLLLSGHVNRALRTAHLAAALNSNVRNYLPDAADVARAMKAVDSTVYRANQYMLSAARRYARMGGMH